MNTSQIRSNCELALDAYLPDEVAEAHRYVEAEKNFGRVLLTID